MRIKNHRLEGIRFIESPNQDHRPLLEDLDLIVIHCISLPPGQFGTEGIIELFTNRLDPEEHPYYQGIASLKVSSHLVIRRDGEIIQFVPFDRRAFHAGISSYQGREACNDFSIGIELEGTDDTGYEAIQYDQLNLVIDALMTTYPTLSRSRMAGHQEIAPLRKTDPGPFFEWHRVDRGDG